MNDPKSRHWIDSVDLSIRARRGCLQESERRMFQEALESSTTLGTAHQVGCDFDRVSTVRAGDEALIARLAEATVAGGRKPAPRARRRRRVFALAATLVLGGSAAAFWGKGPPRTHPERASAGVEREVARRMDAARELAAPVPSAAPACAEAPTATATVVPKAAHAKTSVLASRAPTTAGALFRSANAARHAGDFERARSLYLRLEQMFPSSDEARLAHVSLGKLFLAMGRAEDADRQFDSYLGDGQTLAEEALFGRAQSLAKLNREAEERRVWERLLHDYPASVYAANARARLAVLPRSEP